MSHTTREDSAAPHTASNTSSDREIYVSQNVPWRNKMGYDFTKIEDMGDCISTHQLNGGRCEIERLKGGSTNHVYLAINRREGKNFRTIFKHAAQHLSSNPTFALATERVEYEARILERFAKEPIIGVSPLIFRTTGSLGSTVCPVGFCGYDTDVKILSLTYGGNFNLRQAYPTLRYSDTQDIGFALGIWLAQLHAKTPKTHVSETVTGCRNNMTGVQIGRYAYRELHTVLVEYGHDEGLGIEIDWRFGGMIASDAECVVHGDFWPGNIVLDHGEMNQGLINLKVIDWEMVRIGNSATDVGQFAAEAFLLDRSCGHTDGLRGAFIRGYLKTSAVKNGSRQIMYSWMTRVAIHFAVHIGFWPTRKNHWTRSEDTRALVDLAAMILRDAISSTPDVTKWKVFDGWPTLAEIAQDFRELRESP